MARMLSKEIINEFEIGQKITKRAMSCVSLPFILSAIEVTGPSERNNILSNVDIFIDAYSQPMRKPNENSFDFYLEHQGRV
jgi:hypothetical protein